MDVLVLIDKLDDQIHNAKPVPLTDQVRVDKEEVYDIRIPGAANFLANGIVAHNSGSIEAEADLVMMLFRSSYYRTAAEGAESDPAPQPKARACTLTQAR